MWVVLQVLMDFDSLKEAQTGLGTAAVIVMVGCMHPQRVWEECSTSC